MTSSKMSGLLLIAHEVARWSTCIKDNVGALIVVDNRIISTGYNGSIPGAQHCVDFFRDIKWAEAHHGWAEQNEVHAEMNAILVCAKNGIDTAGTSMIATHSPCYSCIKAILQAGITQLFYHEVYNEEALEFISRRIKVEHV